MKTRIYLLVILIAGIMYTGHAQQLSLQWAQRLGNRGWDYANSMVVSPAGNYMTGGSLKGILPGDTAHAILVYSNNAYLAALDTNGNILWQKIFGGRMFDNITAMARTADGVLISGIFQDTIRFDDKQAVTTAYSGAYLAEVTEQGNPKWMRNTGGQATIKQIQVCSNPTGVMYMAGTFVDSLQLAGGEKAVMGEKGFFVAGILPDGTETNPIVFKGKGICNLGGIDCSDSLICLAGSFSDTLRIGDTTLITMGGEDLFIAILNTSGMLKHLITAGGIGNEQIRAVDFSPSGEIGIIGSFDYSMLIGNEILQTHGGKDIFIAVADTSGSLKWIRNIGGMGDDYGYTISATANDDYFVSGNFVHYLQMPDENGNLIVMDASSAFGNAFIAKYNAKGELKASFNLPASSEDYCKSILVSESGMITAAGNFYKTIRIPGTMGDTTELVSKGERDIFVLRFKDMCMDVSVDAGADSSLCPGEAIYLTAPEVYPYYRWLPDGLPNQGLEAVTAGTYRLLITDQYGCIASDSLQISMNLMPVVNAGRDTTIAAGESLQLETATADQTITVEWGTQGTGYFGNAGQMATWYSPSFADISAGQVQLSFSGTNTCGTSTDNLMLNIPQDDDGITAFPNPTQGTVNLVCTEGITMQTASITTQGGTVVAASIAVNNTVLQYNLSAYPPGAYIFHLVTGTGTVTKIIDKL